ncbi:hypothetical protein Golob_004327 [Gossypium lobatum]|uniref:DUF4283 domain-containing protein n=1 Tax=Gossypium lobatum TaxID=34289 RepID=A0A7J8N155_9ROSI|nr:hypothetical protein [Gossypium lobatum]
MAKTLTLVEFAVGKNFEWSNNSVGRATKKVRHHTSVPPDLNDSNVDENGLAVQDASLPQVSYKAKLLGASFVQNLSTKAEEDFELQDGNVAMEVVDGVPSIIFSDRVHQFIGQKMALTVIVKLLGKKVGLNALLNQDDFDKVVIGGPWMIFGHYLTVRPWSLNFSTSNDGLDK